MRIFFFFRIFIRVLEPNDMLESKLSNTSENYSFVVAPVHLRLGRDLSDFRICTAVLLRTVTMLSMSPGLTHFITGTLYF